MTKAKTDFTALPDKNLRNRIASAWRRLYALQEEQARRERIKKYGTETPELKEYDATVMISFELTVNATSLEDADAIAWEHGYFEHSWITPGGSVRVDDCYTEGVEVWSAESEPVQASPVEYSTATH